MLSGGINLNITQVKRQVHRRDAEGAEKENFSSAGSLHPAGQASRKRKSPALRAKKNLRAFVSWWQIEKDSGIRGIENSREKTVSLQRGNIFISDLKTSIGDKQPSHTTNLLIARRAADFHLSRVFPSGQMKKTIFLCALCVSAVNKKCLCASAWVCG